MPVHPADHRLVDIEQGEDDPLGHARFVVEQMRVGGAVGDLSDIAAGGKGRGTIRRMVEGHGR